MPLIRKMMKLHKGCSYHALMEHYCPETMEIAKEDSEVQIPGDESLQSNEMSKVITQKEVSMISAVSSQGDSEIVSGEGDIIRHFTPHYRVLSHAPRVNVGGCLYLCRDQKSDPTRPFWDREQPLRNPQM